MKPNHETIYLVPTDYDGGQLTYSWCDCPAPGEGMDPADAIKYVRADLVPASNELLARRIVELTETVTALRNQLAAKPSDSGYAKLQKQVSEQSKVIEHIARAVGEEADPMACWEAVDALKAQIDRLLEPAKEAAEALGFASHHLRGRASENMLMDMAEKADELISAIGSTPAQCLAARDAEIIAQAVDALKFPTMLRKMWSGGEVQAWLKEEAKLIRQSANGGE